MQKNASKRWIFVTKSLPAYFLCSAYLLKLKKLKRTTLFYEAKDTSLKEKYGKTYWFYYHFATTEPGKESKP